jgi:hypothetical protein
VVFVSAKLGEKRRRRDASQAATVSRFWKRRSKSETEEGLS